MNLFLLYRIVLTHLLSRGRQTLFAVLGVTFGIAMYISMNSLMNGVNDYLEEIALENTPHVRLFNEIEVKETTLIHELKSDPNDWFRVHGIRPSNEALKLKDGMEALRLIKQRKEIAAAGPKVTAQVYYTEGPLQIPGMVEGIIPEDEVELYKLEENMVDGEIQALAASPLHMIIGIKLAEKLNKQVNDHIQVFTAEGNARRYRIVGIYKTGINQLDSKRTYANLKSVQSLMNKAPDYITEINIRLKDKALATPLAQELGRQFPYTAHDWQTINKALLSGEIMRNILSYSVAITILLVAGFGIYNILNMTIYEKMQDIAILKAMGFSSSDVLIIFLLNALTIGLVGSVIGLGLGYIIAYSLAQIPIDLEMMDIKHMPVNYKAWYYSTGISFGLVASFMAGYLPSRKAARLDPVQIIRGN